MTNALMCFRVPKEVMECNTKVATETKADSLFSLSNQNIFEQLKESAKNKNTLKATQIWLNGRLKEK